MPRNRAIKSACALWVHRNNGRKAKARRSGGRKIGFEKIGEHQLAPGFYIQQAAFIWHAFALWPAHQGVKTPPGAQINHGFGNLPRLWAEPLADQLWFRPAAPDHCG